MAYKKTVWNNGSTPINDTNLNNIETGIENAYNEIDRISNNEQSLEDKVLDVEYNYSSLSTNVDSITTDVTTLKSTTEILNTTTDSLNTNVNNLSTLSKAIGATTTILPISLHLSNKNDTTATASKYMWVDVNLILDYNVITNWKIVQNFLTTRNVNNFYNLCKTCGIYTNDAEIANSATGYLNVTNAVIDSNYADNMTVLELPKIIIPYKTSATLVYTLSLEGNDVIYKIVDCKLLLSESQITELSNLIDEYSAIINA
jgi:hypothetical protein